MSITVYQYPGCSTCRRAMKWLAQHEVAYSSVHIVERPPEVSVLKRVLQQSPLGLRALFNTSGQSYRTGGFKDRWPTLGEAEALAALAADGKLIKRPLVVGADFALLGFDEAAWSAKLL